MEETGRALDAVEALPVGRGKIDLFAFGRGDSDTGMLGGAVEVAAHPAARVSVFGRGAAGVTWDESGRRVGWEALAGLRMRW